MTPLNPKTEVLSTVIVTLSDRPFHRRAHLPIILASDLVEKPVKVPWWNGLPLRLTTYSGPAKQSKT
jgi:hypothetical protein